MLLQSIITKRRIVEQSEVFHCFHLKNNRDAVIRIKKTIQYGL